MAAITISNVEFADNDADISLQPCDIATVGSVYWDQSTGLWKNADANVSAVTAGRDGIGILMNDVTVQGRYGVIIKSGNIYINTLGTAAGTPYIVGAVAAGDIAPATDQASGWFGTVLGVAGTEDVSTHVSDSFIMRPVVSGVAKA